MNHDKKMRKSFKFGENWSNYLATVDENRIKQAEFNLMEMLGDISLDGLTFLDIGSGSGIHSLAARRLGASVYSFDYDPVSVWCTQQLRQKLFPNDDLWKVDQGSVLDEEYLNILGEFDIVYAWGVLHHTGEMFRAMDLVVSLVKPGGYLFIALYNDQGFISQFWRIVKQIYNNLPSFLQPLLLFPYATALWGPTIIRDTFQFRILKTWNEYYKNRGMSPWTDMKDWLGGYPFEVVKPETVVAFFRDRGFLLLKSVLIGRGAGNNQFIFKKRSQ
jgi:2-polyprenyl-3-methyl-5-hydroxy-6-metoxy-1,4-benzoquinol methylase